MVIITNNPIVSVLFLIALFVNVYPFSSRPLPPPQSPYVNMWESGRGKPEIGACVRYAGGEGKGYLILIGVHFLVLTCLFISEQFRFFSYLFSCLLMLDYQSYNLTQEIAYLLVT